MASTPISTEKTALPQNPYKTSGTVSMGVRPIPSIYFELCRNLRKVTKRLEIGEGRRPHPQQGTATTRQRRLRLRATRATRRKGLQRAAATIISTQKFESAGVDRKLAERQSTEELHGTKRSASRGESAQIPGRRRSGRYGERGDAAGGQRRNHCEHARERSAAAALGAPSHHAGRCRRDRNAEGAATHRRRSRLRLHGRC